jgi:hypothetical protein
MWGTFMLDAYRREEAPEMRSALERLLGPASGNAWSTAGIYIFWEFETRIPRYIGISGDIPERFAQHNGLRRSSGSGSKKDEIQAYFDQHEKLGYTVLALSHLSQADTYRQRRILRSSDPEIIQLRREQSKEVIDSMRAVEGALIAAAKARFGADSLWNDSPGRIPELEPDLSDVTLATAVGVFDCLLQARLTIRGLADDGLANLFEEQLHAIRILIAPRFSNARLREMFQQAWFVDSLRDEILKTGYLDRRNPLTVGPILD